MVGFRAVRLVSGLFLDPSLRFEFEPRQFAGIHLAHRNPQGESILQGTADLLGEIVVG